MGVAEKMLLLFMLDKVLIEKKLVLLFLAFNSEFKTIYNFQFLGIYSF